MNIGITTSFIVGGLLLLSILHMNMAVSNNSMQTTMQMTSKNYTKAVSETIAADVQRMGFQVAGEEVRDVILIAESDRIQFKTDLDDDGSVETITWELTSTEFSKSSNPDDYELVRTGPVKAGGAVNAKSVYPVTSFEVTYYDTRHQDLGSSPDIEDIDQIGIEIITESPEPITMNGGKKSYGRSFWQRTFVPPSLHIRQANK
jgi:hypothetical protein